jgi:CheY-like chemotaxis protein
MNKRVLIVEDHDSLRYVMGAFLSKNFEVIAAKNGLEAMSWLRQGVVPDVILTDVSMPELDGASLLSNLRCSGLYANIPVVVISGADNGREERHFREMGANAYIRKPFNPVQLQERLMAMVR